MRIYRAKKRKKKKIVLKIYLDDFHGKIVIHSPETEGW